MYACGLCGSKPEHLHTGRRGEEEAYFYLRRLGYVMVARNWCSRRSQGEIDLVGWDGDVLCFIKVKPVQRVGQARRSSRRCGKTEALRGMAQEYSRRMSANVHHRFDILNIYTGNGRPAEFELFKNSIPLS